MKFDMHCHTKEGSLDGKAPIEEMIGILKERGFDGMLISDHDSYNGYRAWKKAHGEQPAHSKGIRRYHHGSAVIDKIILIIFPFLIA